MKLAILGAAGQVGQEFVKQLGRDNAIPITHDQIDVTDRASIKSGLSSLNCDVVVNLAAFHDVNGCEDDTERAFDVNARGAHLVAQVAAEQERSIVFLSSDYVFGADRERHSSYMESDTPGPVNVYGVSKMAGEQLVRLTTRHHLIVRSSSLFGVVTSRKGWTFPEMILERARKGQPLKVVNDQYMSPTYTWDLVQAVLALLKKDAEGTVHVTNSGGCTWYEFAKATLELAGMDYPIEPVGSDAFPSPASRPSYSRLDSERLASWGLSEPRPWREALHSYLIEKGVAGA